MSLTSTQQNGAVHFMSLTSTQQSVPRIIIQVTSRNEETG
jgi:hypothetical protein